MAMRKGSSCLPARMDAGPCYAAMLRCPAWVISLS